MSNPKLNFKEETSAKKTRSPPKKARVEQSTPKKKKLKLDADKAAEKNQHLRFGKAELTPDELSRLSKAQKREMYAANAARTAVHREIDQYEEDNVGVQALSEGEKAAGNVRDISKSRYARKLKKKAKVQGKKNSKTAKSSAQEPTASQNAGASGIGTREGGSNWLSRWRQKHDIRQSYYAAARSGGTAAQTVGGKKAVSDGASAARSGVEQVVDKGKSVVSTAVNGLMNAAKSNAHVLVIVGVFVLLILHGDVWFFLLRHPLFGQYPGIRADDLFCRGQGHPGCRTGLQEAGKGTGQKNQAHSAPTIPATTSTSTILTPSSMTRGSSLPS